MVGINIIINEVFKNRILSFLVPLLNTAHIFSHHHHSGEDLLLIFFYLITNLSLEKRRFSFYKYLNTGREPELYILYTSIKLF